MNTKNYSDSFSKEDCLNSVPDGLIEADGRANIQEGLVEVADIILSKCTDEEVDLIIRKLKKINETEEKNNG